jgi:hypothetical protein
MCNAALSYALQLPSRKRKATFNATGSSNWSEFNKCSMPIAKPLNFAEDFQ